MALEGSRKPWKISAFPCILRVVRGDLSLGTHNRTVCKQAVFCFSKTRMWLVLARYSHDLIFLPIQNSEPSISTGLTLLTYLSSRAVHHLCYIKMQTAKAVAVTAPGWKGGRGGTKLTCEGWVSGRSGITENKLVICNVQRNRIIYIRDVITDRTVES